eukprot:2410496-Amphidinium_carterae.3
MACAAAGTTPAWQANPRVQARCMPLSWRLPGSQRSVTKVPLTPRNGKGNHKDALSGSERGVARRPDDFDWLNLPLNAL